MFVKSAFHEFLKKYRSAGCGIVPFENVSFEKTVFRVTISDVFMESGR